MKITIPSLIGVCLRIACLGQGSDGEKKVHLDLIGGLGLSYFHYDVENLNKPINGETHRFAAPNLRLGVAASRRIANRLTIRAGFRLGLRTRRSSLYDDVRTTGIVPPYTFYYIDESVSRFTYYFYEIPIGLEIGNNGLRVGLAGVFRSKIPMGDFDVGTLPSLWYVPNNKFRIGAEYYVGTVVGIRDIVHDDYNNTISFGARTRSVQLTFDWRLR
jgi:hypothetical protein